MLEASEKGKGFKSKMTDGNGAYTYDDNGNMVTDAHKSMTVTYNYLNLPTKIIKPEGEIEWIYDATGTKLSKTVTTNHLEVNDNPMLSKEYKAQMIESQGTVASGGDVTFTAEDSITLKEGFTAGVGSELLARILPNTAVQVRDYCSGVEYFENSLEAIYFDGGRVFYTGSVTERQYILTDYQGNTRVLFKDLSGIAEAVEDYSGYYPYGAIHTEASDYQQKYLFGGKELQTELSLDWAEFGPRCLDSWKARWEGIDIMSEVIPQSSPYGYTLGNPIRYSDPTGMLTEENGLITTSTSLLGRDATGGENTGEVLDSKFLSEGQLARDTDTYTFNEHAGNEVGREITDNGVNITYEGAWTGGINYASGPSLLRTDGLPEYYGGTPLAFQVTGGTGAKALSYLLGAAAIGTVAFAHNPSGTTGTGSRPVAVPTTSGPDGFKYVTYLKTNPATGFVYVGRSSGYGTPTAIVKRRDSGHHMTNKGYGKATLSTFAVATIGGGYAKRGLDPAYWAIRGSEQLQIESYRALGISGNDRNGIGSTNPRLNKYINAVKNTRLLK